MKDLAELEKKLQYTFRDKELLRTALTHSSYANEHKGRATCNERLEFLGDAVLGVVVADYLYLHFPAENRILERQREGCIGHLPAGPEV